MNFLDKSNFFTIFLEPHPGRLVHVCSTNTVDINFESMSEQPLDWSLAVYPKNHMECMQFLNSTISKISFNKTSCFPSTDLVRSVQTLYIQSDVFNRKNNSIEYLFKCVPKRPGVIHPIINPPVTDYLTLEISPISDDEDDVGGSGDGA